MIEHYAIIAIMWEILLHAARTAHPPSSENICQLQECSIDQNGEWKPVHQNWELDNSLTLFPHSTRTETWKHK